MRKFQLNSLGSALVVLVVLLLLPSRTSAAFNLVQNITGCQSGASTVTNFTATFFAGGTATVNHLLVVAASARDAATISTPAGYSVIFNQATQNAAPSLALFYKVASGGETGAQVFFGGPTRPCVSVAEYFGTSFNSPLHGKSLGLLGIGTTLGTGTIDIINTDDLGVAVFSNNNTNFTASYTNPPAADRYMDRTFGGLFGGTTNAKTSIFYADCVVGSCAGTTSTTISNGGDWRGQIASFYPKTTSGNTPTGTNVVTTSGNASLTFPNVTGSGTTTVDSIDPTNPSQGSPPSGIMYFSTSPAYNITTTATFTGSINVCISAATITDPAVFANLKLLHKEGATLVNRTTAVNFSSKLVCGSVTSLSPFIIGTSSSPTAATAVLGGKITDADGAPLAGATVRLSGGSLVTTVADSDGRYYFENLQTNQFYTVTPSLANHQFSPANRSVALVGNRTDATFTGSADATDSANAVDTTEYFVRQQYLDFLGREPEQGGFDFWSGEINKCNGDAQCIRNRRVDVSAAFFASPEFQRTGSYVYGLYAGTLGRLPGYNEFTSDRAQVVAGPDLDQREASFADDFILRPEFTAKYPVSMSRDEFLGTLLQTMSNRAGTDLSLLRLTMQRDYDVGGRSMAVRDAVQQSAFVLAEYNKAFVLAEYFGYLRRDPDSGGYDFWLTVLNSSAAGNHRDMVCAFTTSTEYQRRFGSLVTSSNAECGR